MFGDHENLTYLCKSGERSGDGLALTNRKSCSLMWKLDYLSVCSVKNTSSTTRLAARPSS